MVNYYDTPIPGIGRDFHHLITDEAAYLSNQIGQANAQRIADDTNYVLSNLEAPGITQPMAIFLYALLQDGLKGHLPLRREVDPGFFPAIGDSW
jgi:hypothetical protein